MIKPNKPNQMNNIKSLDRGAVRTINADIESALQAVATKYGITISLGNATFSKSNCDLKIKYAVQGDSGMAITREVEDYNRLAKAMFNTTKQVGDQIEFNGDTFEIVGLKPRSHRYPLLAKSMRDGKTYKLPSIAIENK